MTMIADGDDDGDDDDDSDDGDDVEDYEEDAKYDEDVAHIAYRTCSYFVPQTLELLLGEPKARVRSLKILGQYVRALGSKAWSAKACMA